MRPWIGRSRLGYVLPFLLAWAVTGCPDRYPRGEQSPARTGRPNIVVFVSDDLGFNDIGYHNSEIDTPNLDRLARTGVRLEQFYVCPTCSPTRAALLTGRNPSRYDILGPIAGRSRQALPQATATLATRLRQLGYATAIVGKWHLGLRPEVGPRKYGFDYSYGYLHGQVDPYTHRYKTGDRTWHRNDEFIDEQGHVTDLLAREAAAFIERERSGPFFLYVPFSVPHTPLDEPQRWTRPYAERIGNKWRRQFAASVTHMDDVIGQVCATLARLGLQDDTLILFHSDNGGQQSWSSKTNYEGRYPAHDQLGDNRPLRGWKGELYEGGIRVPALVNWPKRLGPRTVKDVISVLDVLPTLVAVAGGQDRPQVQGVPGAVGGALEGMNVWPVLTGEHSPGQRVLYWKTGGQYALRAGDWKLIQNRQSGGCELFNLADDPYEKNDLAGDQPERVQQLLEQLRHQQAGDPGGAAAEAMRRP